MINQYKNFCSKEECEELIRQSLQQLKPALTLGQSIEGFRVAESCWLPNSEFIENYRNKISKITNLPVENMESLHIVKYEIGGQYKNHQDFFHPGEEYYEPTMKRGGQRLKTALLYLNDNFEGGETNFPEYSVKIKPETGKLVVWDNLNEDGSLDYKSIHAGLPVISGTKFIATIWIRERVFG